MGDRAQSCWPSTLTRGWHHWSGNGTSPQITWRCLTDITPGPIMPLSFHMWLQRRSKPNYMMLINTGESLLIFESPHLWNYFWLFSKGPAQSPKTSLVSSLLVPSTVNFPFLSESTLSWASPLTTVGVLHTIQTTYEIWSALQKLLLSLNPTFCCSDYFWRLQVQKLQKTNDIAHGWKNAFCNFS